MYDTYSDQAFKINLKGNYADGTLKGFCSLTVDY
jgi:hypothetical protein